jgi:hypothetical protein
MKVRSDSASRQRSYCGLTWRHPRNLRYTCPLAELCTWLLVVVVRSIGSGFGVGLADQ